MNHLTDPQKKERPKSLSFCSDNTVTDDQQAAPVHSGFRAYSRCDRLPHAVRSQGSENCCRYPNWVIRVVRTVVRLLPVYLDERTSPDRSGMSRSCQQRRRFSQNRLRLFLNPCCGIGQARCQSIRFFIRDIRTLFPISRQASRPNDREVYN
jgi:hypothetical protein